MVSFGFLYKPFRVSPQSQREFVLPPQISRMPSRLYYFYLKISKFVLHFTFSFFHFMLSAIYFTTNSTSPIISVESAHPLLQIRLQIRPNSIRIPLRLSHDSIYRRATTTYTHLRFAPRRARPNYVNDLL